jgi:hypothetical protein
MLDDDVVGTISAYAGKRMTTKSPGAFASGLLCCVWLRRPATVLICYCAYPANTKLAVVRPRGTRCSNGLAVLVAAWTSTWCAVAR